MTLLWKEVLLGLVTMKSGVPLVTLPVARQDTVFFVCLHDVP